MKTAIVTGGAKGIGLAISKKLIADGNKVIIFDVIQEGETIASQIGAEFKKVDISNHAEVTTIAKPIDADILINNAGISIDNLLIRMKESDWDKVISVNLKGVFNCTYAVLPAMIKKRWGRIVNMSSVIGIMGNKGQTSYAASKAGIIGFTKSVAKEVASRNITCNAIAPGFISTDMTDKLPQEVKDAYIKTIPLARPGTPEEIAELVSFLISDNSSYITGQVINIDGGMVM
ncbi:MAG: 3-oxoacyl-[acyl-carrier-protein] reductase [bacterium]|nr:3-oxoacyl-[acyl-carrier-protein] reductase [bacterium]